jgi:hypothetical protein
MEDMVVESDVPADPVELDSYMFPPGILQMWGNGKKLGMISYSQLPGLQFGEIWSSSDMGQGPDAIEWLTVSMTPGGRQSVVQLWDNGGQLGMIVYGAQENGSYKSSWSSSDMGQGSGAMAWLTVDMDGSGRTSIVQLWDNDGQLGMIVYSPQADGSFKATWSSSDMGQGSGALDWLTVNMDGSGKVSIVQPWKNGSSLGMIVYSPQSDGSFKASWSSGDLGQGPGAVQWLTANVDDSGTTSIVQLWANGSSLGMIVYSPQSDGSFEVSWSNSNMGQGPGAIQWLTTSAGESGRTSIIQLWANGSSLGMIVYSPQNDGSFKSTWSTSDIGAGPGASAWLTADMGGMANSIVQVWNNSGSLGMIEYRPQNDGSFKIGWNASDMGEGSGAVAWLATEPYTPLKRNGSPAHSAPAYPMDGRIDQQAVLWAIVTKAKDLLGLFNQSRTFFAWYNKSPTAETKAVNHPREISHRCINDLNESKSEYGVVFAIENQTNDTLYLDGTINWYGWPLYCLVPQRIEALETAFFDRNYSAPYNAAAAGFRYKIGTTGWYLYLAAYTYRFNSNCMTYVQLSRRGDISWNDIYQKLLQQDSNARTPDGSFLAASSINLQPKAKAVFQLALGENSGILSSINYFLNPWQTPQDYHDEL